MHCQSGYGSRGPAAVSRRRIVVACASLFAAALMLQPAAALDYPTRTVHVIVPVHRRRRARRADAADRSEALGKVGARRRRREPRRRQHADRHRRRSKEPAGRLHADARRRPDLRAQSAALHSLPYSMKEFDPIVLMASIAAHARGREQSAGVERQGVDRAGQGQARHPHSTAPPDPAPSSASRWSISPASPASSSSRCPTRAPTKPPRRSSPARST